MIQKQELEHFLAEAEKSVPHLDEAGKRAWAEHCCATHPGHECDHSTHVHHDKAIDNASQTRALNTYIMSSKNEILDHVIENARRTAEHYSESNLECTQQLLSKVDDLKSSLLSSNQLTLSAITMAQRQVRDSNSELMTRMSANFTSLVQFLADMRALETARFAAEKELARVEQQRLWIWRLIVLLLLLSLCIVEARV